MEEKVEPQTTQIEPTRGEKSTPEPEITRSRNRVKPVAFTLSGLIIAAGFFVGGYKFSQVRQSQVIPTPTPTPLLETTEPATETYKDAFSSFKYKYSFDYDRKWFYKNLTDKKAIIGGPDSIDFLVEVIETDVSDPREWWNSQESNPFNFPTSEYLTSDFEVEDTTVVGKPAIKLKVKPENCKGPGCTGETYLVFNYEWLYRILVVPQAGLDPFSSFKFTE